MNFGERRLDANERRSVVTAMLPVRADCAVTGPGAPGTADVIGADELPPPEQLARKASA
jgi:hypothetical protein